MLERPSAQCHGASPICRTKVCDLCLYDNIQLLMSCGTENAVLSVAEAEKCEYEFKVTSPALCLPLSSTEEKSYAAGREEL